MPLTLAWGRTIFLSLLEFVDGRKFIGAQAVDLVERRPGAQAAEVLLVHFQLDFRVAPVRGRCQKAASPARWSRPFCALSPSTAQLMVTSRSVAVNSSLLSSARKRTLERMGSVVRVLTMFCTDLQSMNKLVFCDG